MLAIHETYHKCCITLKTLLQKRTNKQTKKWNEIKKEKEKQMANKVPYKKWRKALYIVKCIIKIGALNLKQNYLKKILI